MALILYILIYLHTAHIGPTVGLGQLNQTGQGFYSYHAYQGNPLATYPQVHLQQDIKSNMLDFSKPFTSGQSAQLTQLTQLTFPPFLHNKHKTNGESAT